MATAAGFVGLLTINDQQASFKIVTPGPFAGPFILFSDAPNTHTIPQVELARRSWMISLLHGALIHEDLVIITYDEAGKLVRQLSVSPLNSGDVEFDFQPKQAAPEDLRPFFPNIKPRPPRPKPIPRPRP